MLAETIQINHAAISEQELAAIRNYIRPPKEFYQSKLGKLITEHDRKQFTDGIDAFCDCV